MSLWDYIKSDLKGFGKEMGRQVGGSWGVQDQIFGSGSTCDCKRKKCNTKKCGCRRCHKKR